MSVIASVLSSQASGSVLLRGVKRSWSLYQSLSFKVPAHGHAVPVMTGMGLANLDMSEKDRRFIALLRKILDAKPGAVVDVGANIGRYILYLLQIDAHRPYVGFDVHVACARYVEEIIRANDLRSHCIFPIGLSDRPGVVTLRTDDDNDVSATVVDGAYPSDRFTRKKPVWVDVGDRVLADLNTGPIALIKVDVEGGEIDVLRGMTQIIQRHRPFLIVEIIPPCQATDDTVQQFRRRRINELEQFLSSFGYTVAKIENGDTLRPMATLDPGASIDKSEMDYLCVPRDLAGFAK